MAQDKVQDKVTVKALKVLRAGDGKKVPIGKTTEVPKSVADILVKNKQAELVAQTKA